MAIRGMVAEVGGRIFETRSKKTTMESRTEMVRVIFSVESAGRKSTDMDKKDIKTVGMIRTTV